MTRPVRPRQRARSGDGGFTLVELLVTVMLSMLVLALVTGLVQTSRGILVTEKARTVDLGVGFPAMDQMQRSLRAAVKPPTAGMPIAVASATAVTVHSLTYTDATPDETASAALKEAAQPRRVTLAYDQATGTLRMTSVMPRLSSGTWSYTGATTTRVLATGVVNDAATPLFTYRDKSGATLTTTTTDADRAAVAYVEVHLVLDTNNGDGRPVEILDTVRLANYGTEDLT